MIRLDVTWGPLGSGPRRVWVCKRWFPWPTDNATFYRWVFLRHLNLLREYPAAPVTVQTMRHELSHVLDYHVEGGWWVIVSHRAESERRARARQTEPWPTFTVMP